MSPIDTKPLVALQEQLAGLVSLKNQLPAWKKIRTVAGCDVSCRKHGKTGYAAIVVLSFPDLKYLARQTAVGPLEFPYIPGLLSFRELPLLLECWQNLEEKPDAVICDAQGFAHPRGAGLASHFGVATGAVTVGCAKTRLTGEFEQPHTERGSRSDLVLNNKKIGEVLRTQDGIKPLFISPGHRIDFRHASELILRVTPMFRLPEPIRAAHRLVNQLRMEHNDR